ncbi:hypothetical protein PSEUBRA_004201 [Kalmanozyma brasiliensis GHG001]|uniref:uncharacterized protein n=1 Tax=Kalmanozyma brasiliensis (strain GHG001) TaxID=1365824 RepID=UPI0028682ED1|nr:uncharacterized protein PSEUBRA_004201 [Kalmanozyma brasiliensis GHG001]EST06315.2 hypothetical protein PSEUBRA_004201 [Kalmanozyma brasiliensis GHG001]
MRRPAPPPQSSDDVELDYGSAEASGSGSHFLVPSEDLGRNEVDAPTASRGRKLLAYETDHFDATAPPASLPIPEASNPIRPIAPPAGDHFEDNAYTSPEEGAIAGPSSPDRPAYNFSSYDNLPGGTYPGHADLHHPPPPIYPPPDLPHASSAHYAYDPNAPAFEPAPPVLDYSSSVHHTYNAAAVDDYPAGFDQAFPSYEPSYQPGHEPAYDPRAPYDSGAYRNPELYGHSYASYPSASSSFQPSYPGTFDGAYPTGCPHFQMAGHRPQNLLKQQKKQERKQRKREKKQLKLAAKIAAHNAYLDAYNGASSSVNVGDATYEEDVDWVEDACCEELGISTQGEARHEVEAPATSPPPAASEPNSVEEEGRIVTTLAEDAAQEQGVALKPLEELRKKVLASRMAKVAAASAAANSAIEPAAAVSAAPSATTNVFDRTATSGEADALLSQIGESIRGLIRPSYEAGVAMEEGVLVEDSSNDSALPSSRKRAYRDVDAVDDGDNVVTADLAGDENASAPLPSRRQRISYADNFSRAAKAPSGEVDLTAPIPNLPDLATSAAKSPLLTEAASRRRPVAADFDVEEYRPLFRPNRFLDVPSGLNTVVDLSDDELEEDEPNVFEMSKYTRLDVDASDVALLRQKTADEHYDNFCALNGLQPVRRALTPLQDGVKMVEGTNGTAHGTSVSREGLLAGLAANGSADAGSSAPSHEELLRKELEIKLLMRKIQMMEERKSKQQTAAIASPSAGPMPPRYHQSADMTPVPPGQPLTATVQAVSMPATVIAAAAPSADAETPRKSVQQSSANAMKLDAALQKKREELLASLASKRKNATAVKVLNGVTPGEQLGEVATASTQDHVSTAPSNGSPSESIIMAKPGDQEKVTPHPPVVSRYRPVVPSLFQSITSKVRSYLPPSLGFSVASSSRSADERTSVKWCPREADGDECADARCTQRHAREFDAHQQ